MYAYHRPCYTREEAHKLALEYERDYEEFQCEADPRRSRARLHEIRQELATIYHNEEIMANDPMTAYLGV